MKNSKNKRKKIMLIVAIIILLMLALEHILAIIQTNNFLKYTVSANDSLSIKISEIAKKLQPSIAYSKNLRFPPTEIFYYPYLKENKLILSYRIIRENEEHPNAIIDFIYKIFRILYYGSMRDIEYIEYMIDLSSGFVDAIRFEEGKVEKIKVKHLVVEMIRKENGNFTKYYQDNPSHVTIFQADYYAKSIVFVMETWNGLFQVKLKNQTQNDIIVEDLPLHSYSWWVTFKYRIWRRSSGWK